MGDVVRLEVTTTVDHEPDYILEQAKGQDFAAVLVIGLRPGEPLWVSASSSDVERAVFMLEWAKREFLDHAAATCGEEE